MNSNCDATYIDNKSCVKYVDSEEKTAACQYHEYHKNNMAYQDKMIVYTHLQELCETSNLQSGNSNLQNALQLLDVTTSETTTKDYVNCVATETAILSNVLSN